MNKKSKKSKKKYYKLTPRQRKLHPNWGGHRKNCGGVVYKPLRRSLHIMVSHEAYDILTEMISGQEKQNGITHISRSDIIESLILQEHERVSLLHA